MISPVIKELVNKTRESLAKKSASEGAAKIHVDEIASRVAAFYEKVRNIIDYQEEHLLRRRFVHRVFRRRMILSLEDSIAESIIKDTIRSGHLPNDSVPESKIQDVQKVIENYGCLLRNLNGGNEGRREAITEWLRKITASAIEEELFPPIKDHMIADLMFFTLKDHLVVKGGTLTEEEINSQLFIAVQKALLRVDEDQLHYRLLKFVYPQWNTVSKEECPRIAKELPAIREKIEKLTDHPLAPMFYRLCDRYNTVFYILSDVIDEEMGYEALEKSLSNEEQLQQDVEIAYEKRFKKEKKRLNRLAFLSVLSFFISKIAVAIAIEIPIEMRLVNGFSLINTIINIAFPPFLMFLIVTSIRMPSSENVDLVLEEVKNVVYEERPKKYVLEIPKKKGLMGSVVRLFYFLVFIISFYYLTLLLLKLNFNAANIVIFTFFTALVAATGVKLNNRSKEISLEEKKSTILSFLVDVFALPLITLGKWIIRGLAKFNILVVLINLIVELPFQLFVEFLESLRGFIKSKKEEIN